MTKAERLLSIKKWCNFIDDVLDRVSFDDHPYRRWCSFCTIYMQSSLMGVPCGKCPLCNTEYNGIRICHERSDTIFNFAVTAAEEGRWLEAFNLGLIVLEAVMTLSPENTGCYDSRKKEFTPHERIG